MTSIVQEALDQELLTREMRLQLAYLHIERGSRESFCKLWGITEETLERLETKLA